MIERVAALCRLDERWVDRVERSNGLRGLTLQALALILVGGAAYGWVFGWWRGTEQALYAAIKLPLLLILVAVIAAVASSMLGTMLGARLSFAQTVVCLLASLGITAAILGGLAPISAFLVAHAAEPSKDPSSLSTAQAILSWHVVVVGVAGWVGVSKLGTMLSRLVAQPAAARRVHAVWILLVGASGAELSWLLRPFLGKPHLEQSFFRQEALQGSFFEEVGGIASTALGSAGSVVWFAVILMMLVAWSRGAINLARLRIVEGGVELDLGRPSPIRLAFAELGRIRVVGPDLHVDRQDRTTLRSETYVVRLGDMREAQQLADELEGLRLLPSNGPFRT